VLLSQNDKEETCLLPETDCVWRQGLSPMNEQLHQTHHISGSRFHSIPSSDMLQLLPTKLCAVMEVFSLQEM
jgi:hypothetical protein